MSLKVFLIIHTIVGLIFGLGFMLAPEASMSTYQVTLGQDGLGVVRYLGASFIAMGLVAFFVRNDEGSAALKGVLTAMFIGMILGAGVALFNQFAVRVIDMVWLSVAIYGLLAVGYGYFRFVKKIT